MPNVLVLAPHTDDESIGCGGTLAKLREQGKDMLILAFSPCIESLPGAFKKDDIISEFWSAAETLKCKSSLRGYPVRTFPSKRQNILQDMINVKDEWSDPTVVFCPSLNDTHQDHKTVAEEAIRAFPHANILCYELPIKSVQFEPKFFVGLEDRHIKAKRLAMECYKSQMGKENYQLNLEYMEALAKFRGMQNGTPYAEAFEVIRWRI